MDLVLDPPKRNCSAVVQMLERWNAIIDVVITSHFFVCMSHHPVFLGTGKPKWYAAKGYDLNKTLYVLPTSGGNM